MDYNNCRQLKTDRIIVVEENKKKFTLNNPTTKDIYQVKVDGCLIPKQALKCDYLFEINNPISAVLYIELKGNDIKHAYEQLIATVEFCKTSHQTVKRECHIVHSSSPKISSTAQVLKKKLKDKYGIISFTYTNQGWVNLGDIG